MFMILMYLVVAIFSIVFAAIKMCSPSVSKEAAKIIWKRHVLSAVAFIATNAYTWFNILYMLNHDYRNSNGAIDIHDTYVLVFKLMFCFQGIFVPITRIVEPYFFQVIADELRFKKKKEIKKDFESDVIARGVNLAH